MVMTSYSAVPYCCCYTEASVVTHTDSGLVHGTGRGLLNPYVLEVNRCPLVSLLDYTNCVTAREVTAFFIRNAAA